MIYFGLSASEPVMQLTESNDTRFVLPLVEFNPGYHAYNVNGTKIVYARSAIGRNIAHSFQYFCRGVYLELRLTHLTVDQGLQLVGSTQPPTCFENG